MSKKPSGLGSSIRRSQHRRHEDDNPLSMLGGNPVEQIEDPVEPEDNALNVQEDPSPVESSPPEDEVPQPEVESVSPPVEEDPQPVAVRQEVDPVFVGVFSNGPEPCYLPYGLVKDGVLHGVIALEHSGWIDDVNNRILKDENIPHNIRNNAPYEVVRGSNLPQEQRDKVYHILMRTGNNQHLNAIAAVGTMGYNPGAVERVSGGTLLRFSG